MNKHIIPSSATLLDALAQLNRLSGGEMTLFVTDSDSRVVGSLTDGDIRRALLAGRQLTDTVADAACRTFKAVGTERTDLATNIVRECRAKGISMVPRIDDKGRLVDIINLSRTRSLLPLSAILMAGGKGERLRPMTLTTPKPLLQIEGKAIIDYNIEALAAVGIDNITVTTRYLAQQLFDHFAEPVAGVQVKCVLEDQPLGTIGSAALADIPAEGNTIVMNSDLLTTINFEELYLKHRDSGAEATIAVIPYQVSVPYAILTLDNDRVTGIAEKPAYSYYANAGIYIFNNKLLRALPLDRRTDATDLVEQIIARDGHVAYYPIKGTWIDVGSPVDFRQAGELMRHHRNLTSL